MTTVKKPKATNAANTKALLDKQDMISSATSEGRAKLGLMPEANAALVIEAMSKSLGAQSIPELITHFHEQTKAINNGKMVDAEAMLISQSSALQTIFTELVRRSALNMGQHIKAAETYMRLALKAQAQCTRTLEVLAAIKNPPLVIAKQANIANGPQQVNNASSRVENQNGNNELLGADYEEVDDRATQTPSITHQGLATLGKFNRTQKHQRKS